MVNNKLSLLTEALDLNIDYVNLKGRENYLDLNAVISLLATEDNNHEEVLRKMRLLTWLLERETGDLYEIDLKGTEEAYYKTLLIRNGRTNEHYYFDRSIEKADNAPVVFTNHYFIQDCLELLSHSKYLIVDEAHQLNTSLNQRTQTEYNYQSMKFFLGKVGTPRQNRLLSSY